LARNEIRREEKNMPWVITSLCRDCVDQSCVEACPVDCIYEYTGHGREIFPNQLFIDPEECIDCAMCEPACPWQAIFDAGAVPELFWGDVAFNSKIVYFKDQFRVPKKVGKPVPTAAEIEANKRKWSFAS
jgi:ferredoxin